MKPRPRIVIHNHYSKPAHDSSSAEVARVVRGYKNGEISRERALRLLKEYGASANELDK